MKKLTGRAAEDFYKHTRYTETTFDLIDELFQNALIIEWFDSVGIYVQVWSSHIFGDHVNFDTDVKYKGKSYSSDIFLDTRAEAINAGITKANELYNLNN